jgi:hypothetical protein
LMKSKGRLTLTIVLFVAALLGCPKSHTGGGVRSLGNLIVNGTGFDGSVHVSTNVMYTLKNIHEGKRYTVRTEIGVLPVSELPDGTLTMDIYSSVEAFTSNPTVPVASASPEHAPNANIYEVYFLAPSSGDYVVVINGTSSTVITNQPFYNLRLMSADPDPTAVPPVLTLFTNPTTTPFQAVQTTPLSPGTLNVYNGGDVASSGTYTISLVSSATTTLSNPQIFVYLDSSLTISSLMVSSIPTSTNFVVTRFSSGVPDTNGALQLDSNIISDITFTSRTDSSDPVGGPFIVLKGFVGLVTYTLTVGP